MIPDFFADIFLCFGRTIIIMPLIGIGYWAYRRDLFSHVLFLILLSMIVNSFLKCLFQVPLKPHLNQHGWYAFPSGHMQLATVLYGRLWWEFRKMKWPHGLLILLGGMGWAMIWKNYHDFMDVAGGALAGIALLLAYGAFVNWRPIQQHREKIGFFLLPLTALLIFLMPSIPQHLAHVWQAQGGLLGFSVGATLLNLKGRIPTVTPWWMMVFKIVLGLSVFGGLSFLNKYLFGSLDYPWFSFFSFFMCGMWLSAGPDGVFRLLSTSLPFRL